MAKWKRRCLQNTYARVRFPLRPPKLDFWVLCGVEYALPKATSDFFMRKLILTLPKYSLAVQYRFIKRRKSLLDEAIIPTPKTLRKKYRVGGYTRRFFRHIFEHRRVKKLLGANIAFMLIATSFMPTNTLGNDAVEESVVISESQTPLTTKKAIQNPVEDMKITQGYRFYHPGIDIDGITGDTIKPIKMGKVVDVSYSRFAYGNSVIIDHGNKLTSLYAHLSKIDVEVGQSVDTTDKLGEMGATGRSFGDHLHLEIRDHGIPINPLSVLPRQ